MKNNSFFTSGTLAEREGRNGYGGGGGGVGGGGEVQGGMPGYSLDVAGEITETEKQTIKTIHEAFKTKVTDVAMQGKLLAILERHAKNNPNFRADQPFLAHDVGTKQAFVFFPPGEAVVCGATHGYGGVGNVSKGGGTSLGSKTLSEGWSDSTMQSRTIVHGLEECNKNDEQRLIRVHESRGPGTKTAGCTGLDPEIAERLQQAVTAAGGGAQETFNSNSLPSTAPGSGQAGENPGQVNAATEKAKETKEKITKNISYAEAKTLIESGAQPTDPPTIYKIDMSTYQISDRYRGNTDPSAGEDAANRNLTDKGKEYIAVHGTASSDISGFHMMLESGLFPYFVSTKGLVFQGADDMTTGSCVSTETANPNMGKYGLDNFNNRGIAIEVSLEAAGGGGIVKPNAAQKKATQQLINTLRGVHDIGAGNVITSADPVRDLNSGNLLPGAHGDDFDDADRAEMGIALAGDVRNRLKTGSFFSDEMATNESIRRTQENQNNTATNVSTPQGIDENYNINLQSGQSPDITVEQLNRNLGGTLSGKGNHFMEAGKMYGIQPRLLAAIAMHETGNGTSSASNTGNLMGISDNSGPLNYRNKNELDNYFNSRGLKQHPEQGDAASIYDQAYKLRNYEPYRGVTNLAQLQSVYAPTPTSGPVSNDSRNLNRHWLGLVQKNMSEIS